MNANDVHYCRFFSLKICYSLKIIVGTVREFTMKIQVTIKEFLETLKCGPKTFQKQTYQRLYRYTHTKYAINNFDIIGEIAKRTCVTICDTR